MFRPLLGHYQVVLNLQSNYTIQSLSSIGDEITFTMFRHMSLVRKMLPIFAIHYSVSLLQPDDGQVMAETCSSYVVHLLNNIVLFVFRLCLYTFVYLILCI